MIYRVNDYDWTMDTIDEVIDWCITSDYHEDEDEFKEYINEIYCDQQIEIAGNTYYAFDVLKGNQQEYDRLMQEYCEEQNNYDAEEARYELDRADNGEVVYIHGYKVTCIDESGDDDGDEDVQREEKIDPVKVVKEALEMQKVKEEKDFSDLVQILR